MCARERCTTAVKHIKLIYACEVFATENGSISRARRTYAAVSLLLLLWESIYVLLLSSALDSMVSFYFPGRPQPQVRWLVNGLLVDDQYEHNSGDVIENRLLWPSVQRTDLNALFTCQAVNTLLVEPKENSYVLDLHCKWTRNLFLVFYFIIHL